MSIIPFSKPKPSAPKSILFDKCKKAIEEGNRGLSLDILLTLRDSCRTSSEIYILETLKARYKVKFEPNPEKWVQSSRIICGTKYLAPDSGGKTIHGGKRVRRGAGSSGRRPKVSIITVNRNCASGLEKTIKSVLNQKDLDFEIEHIIIDGASTDDSVEILRKYEDDIEYFLSEPDGGIYSAMNKGLNYAQGDIIALLNSDDTYLSHTTRISVRNIEKNDVDISYGSFAYVKPNGYVEVVDGPRNWDHSMLIKGIPGGHETLFVRKEIYNLVGGYREDLRVVADYDWMIRAFLAGRTAMPLQSILLLMTMGGASFDNSIEKRESLGLIADYLGEVNEIRAQELYAWKYYSNWNGYQKDNNLKLRLLRTAAKLQEFEPVYSRALLQTVEGSADHCHGFKYRKSSDPDPGVLEICMAVTYLNSVAGGAERIAIEAANRLAEDGHSVTLVCCHGFAGEPFYKLNDKVRFIDLANKPISQELHKIGAEGWKESLEEISNLLTKEDLEDLHIWLEGANKWRTLVYKGFFKSNHFDVIVSHMPSTYPYIALGLAGECNPPVHIAHLQNSPTYKFYSELYPANSPSERRVRLATLGMCDHVSVLFKEYVDELPENLRSRSFVLSNFVGTNFFEGSDRGLTTKRDKSIVTIGRLALQKDQKTLIEAFARIKDRIDGWTLKIYGEGPLRSELREQCIEKGLDPDSVLLGRTSNPKAVYETAGLFVLPSRFEGAPLVLMEAMSAAAPAVGFEDCPGVKFMIESGVNGILVTRDSQAEALANAMLKLVHDEDLRNKIGANALDSSKFYTIDEHIKELSPFLKKNKRSNGSIKRIGDQCRPDKITVAMLSSMTTGGAGTAASRLQQGLHEIGTSASMFSLKAGKIAPSFILEATAKDPHFNPANWRISKTDNLKHAGATIFSSEIGSIGKADIDSITSYDLINLHWVSHLLSPSSVNSLLNSGKPVVWTLHDMLPFTGGCHYTTGCDRFTSTCEHCPQIADNYGDHPQTVLRTKEELWTDRITVVSPSKWLAHEARKSRVFRNSRIEVIPNGIDTVEYQPWNKEYARRSLGLPEHKKIILFACHSHGERRKGFFEALMTLSLLQQQRNDLHLVTIGRPAGEKSDLLVDHTGFGYVHSSRQLSLIYSSCDVTLLPSLEDNLPNIILESLACGTPVAGFRTGGIEDLVKDGLTGYLAPTKDIFALKDSVEKCLASDLTEQCRRFATANLDHAHQASSYNRLFRDLVSK